MDALQESVREDGGREDGGREDGGREDGGREDGGREGKGRHHEERASDVRVDHAHAVHDLVCDEEDRDLGEASHQQRQAHYRSLVSQVCKKNKEKREDGTKPLTEHHGRHEEEEGSPVTQHDPSNFHDPPVGLGRMHVEVKDHKHGHHHKSRMDIKCRGEPVRFDDDSSQWRADPSPPYRSPQPLLGVEPRILQHLQARAVAHALDRHPEEVGDKQNREKHRHALGDIEHEHPQYRRDRHKRQQNNLVLSCFVCNPAPHRHAPA
eukprot:765441-Hanusia_phi.AAC.6